MKTEDVLGVVSALDAQHVPFYLAGGWGIDALLGRQSRAHDDLDIVVDDYEKEVERAIKTLESLGFQLVATHVRPAWMPKISVLDDGAGHRVELVSLNWRILAREFGPDGADATQRKTFEHRVFAQGTVAGREVPCISAKVQLLFHTDFEPGPTLEQDVALLHDHLRRSPSERELP